MSGASPPPLIDRLLRTLQGQNDGLHFPPDALQSFTDEALQTKEDAQLLCLIDSGLQLVYILAEREKSPGASRELLSSLAPLATDLNQRAGREVAREGRRDTTARSQARKQSPLLPTSGINLPTPAQTKKRS